MKSFRFAVKLIIAVLLLFSLAAGPVMAQTYPQPVGYVNDYAYLLSDTARTQMEARLVKLEKDTSAEVAVVTIISLEGDPIEDYAVGLFKNWGIGKKDKNNGILFIMSLIDRKVRIEVGYGLEAIITDGRAGRILDNEVLPHFKNNDYEQGLEAGVAAIESYIRKGTPPVFPEDNWLQCVLNKHDFVMPVSIGLGVITIYLASFMARSKSFWFGGVWGFFVGVVVGLMMGKMFTLIAFPIGFAALGTLLDWILSRNYKEYQDSGRSTGWGQTWGGFSGTYRGGSSSFGGFGGGSSGGGGASRGW
jgi:uncharacterized protein